MKGILGWGVHLPYRRLDRTTIAAVAGAGGGKGTRTVAGFDEDTTTMAVAAARAALRAAPQVEPGALVMATATPAYLDKTNATAVHAALQLRRCVGAFDMIGSVRSAMGALRGGLAGEGATLVVAADIRTGRPGSPDEAAGGDAGVALLLGGDDGSERSTPVLAALIAWSSVTEEFLDRWRTPGDPASKLWEERFGETRYLALGVEAWTAALERAGLGAGDVDLLIVAGLHDRACQAVTKATGVPSERVVDRLIGMVGNVGAAQPALLLVSALEQAQPDQVIALITLADGADVAIFKTMPALTEYRPSARVDGQLHQGGPVNYGKFLAWRGYLPVEPPRRPEPARPSASAATRSVDWKFGLVGEDGPMANAVGTIATFTVDKLAYSPSPPVVFAIVDLDGGSRLPVELTDVDASSVAIGDRVEMTFRRLFSADGIHNYFWKARPMRGKEG